MEQPKRTHSKVKPTLPTGPVPEDIGATVLIQGDTFVMGAPQGVERLPGRPNHWYNDWARPAHEETVPSFAIGKYPVTATEFVAFLNEMADRAEDVERYIQVGPRSTIVREGRGFKPRPAFEWAPALHVRFRGAQRYCRWLSENTGELYRLPSEMEWEFAARGSEGRTYPWGEESPVGRAYMRPYYPYPPSPSTPRNALYHPTALQVGLFPQGATPESVHGLIGYPKEWCGNWWYDYTTENMYDDAEKFRAYARGDVPPPTKTELAPTR